MEDGTSLEKGDGTSLEKGDGTSLEDLFRATAGGDGRPLLCNVEPTKPVS